MRLGIASIPRPVRQIGTDMTAEHKLKGFLGLSAQQPESSREAVLAVLRSRLRLDENGDDANGIKPQPGWETGYCAGIRTAYRVLKNNAGGQDDGTGNHAGEKVATPVPPAPDTASQAVLEEFRRVLTNIAN